MTITLSIFFYLYLIVVFIFVLYTILNFYHLLRFGFYSITNISVMIGFLVVAGSLIALSFAFLSAFNWGLPLFYFDWGIFNNTKI